MAHADTVTNSVPLYSDPLTFSQREVLHSAVAKIVLLGAEVGVGVDEMILLLESGLTVGELLDYLALREAELA